MCEVIAYCSQKRIGTVSFWVISYILSIASMSCSSCNIIIAYKKMLVCSVCKQLYNLYICYIASM